MANAIAIRSDNRLSNCGGAPSVSVVDSVMLADAWATALTAVPYDKALQMARDKGLAVMFIVPKNGVNDGTNTAI